jgi:hypothetical protein
MNKIEIMYQAMMNCKTIADYEEIIRNFGLIAEAGLTIYGGERIYMLKDRDDLGIYQTPYQFARLLDFLKDKKIQSYCEIGVFRGGTFLFMHRFLTLKNAAKLFHYKMKMVCIDPTPENIHPLAYPIIEPYYYNGTSEGFRKNKFDLVFIDGDHSYNWITRDYENLGQYAKICVIHDINEPCCPDVIRFWNELKTTTKRKVLEITGSYGGIITQGIGILY